METGEFVNVVGHLNLRVRNNFGDVIHEEPGENHIVALARGVLANLIASGGADYAIDKVHLGTDSSEALSSNSGVGSYALSVDIASHTVNSTSGSATFYWDLPYVEGNDIGSPISEYGLVTSGGTLFSRVTKTPITKTEGISLEGEWTISFIF